MRDRSDLVWRGLALHVGHETKPLLTIVPDDRSGLFRIRHRDGHLSDTVNLTRAKDAAADLALAELNTSKGSNGHADPPPVRFPRRGRSDIGGDRFERVLAGGRP